MNVPYSYHVSRIHLLFDASKMATTSTANCSCWFIVFRVCVKRVAYPQFLETGFELEISVLQSAESLNLWSHLEDFLTRFQAAVFFCSALRQNLVQRETRKHSALIRINPVPGTSMLGHKDALPLYQALCWNKDLPMSSVQKGHPASSFMKIAWLGKSAWDFHSKFFLLGKKPEIGVHESHHQWWLKCGIFVQQLDWNNNCFKAAQN